MILSIPVVWQGTEVHAYLLLEQALFLFYYKNSYTVKSELNLGSSTFDFHLNSIWLKNVSAAINNRQKTSK